MHYLIGRDLDADGAYEFIQDMDNMILTEDANRALQVTNKELAYIDMDYLNASGFYALEADRFKVSFLEALLFSPLVTGYRPRVAPPPRRRRRKVLKPRLPGLLGLLVPPRAPRVPKPRRAPRVPRPPRPAPIPRARRAAPPPPPPAPGVARIGRPAAKPLSRTPGPKAPGIRGLGRRTPGGRGGRGPGR